MSPKLPLFPGEYGPPPIRGFWGPPETTPPEDGDAAGLAAGDTRGPAGGQECPSVCLSVCLSVPLLACLFVCLSVCLRVGLSVSLLSVTTVNPTKTAEPIEVPFETWTWVRPRNHVSGVGTHGDRPAGGQECP